jgi:hypothetical protein
MPFVSLFEYLRSASHKTGQIVPLASPTNQENDKSFGSPKARLAFVDHERRSMYEWQNGVPFHIFMTISQCACRSERHALTRFDISETVCHWYTEAGHCKLNHFDVEFMS